MARRFEALRTTRTSSAEIRRAVRDAQAIPPNLQLDPTRGQVLAVGERRWTFVLTKGAAAQWNALGREPLTLGALIYQQPVLDAPYVQRLLMALPGRRGSIKLEMRDSSGRLLWTGSGTIRRGILRFSMPIRRLGATARGLVAGGLDRRGHLILTRGILPKPGRRKTPMFLSAD